jgi:hypothetical protein
LVNASLLDERNNSRYKCEDLEAKLKKIRSDSTAGITALEAKVKSVETHSAKVAAANSKRLSDFETELAKELPGLRKSFVRSIHSMGGLCSLMLEGNLSIAYYIYWFSVEVSGLPEVFADVNENFISAVVKGTLMMAGESIDLGALQDAASISEADILPMDRDVRRAACAVSKKWWRSFGYDYVLGAIHAKLHEVTGGV